VKTRFQAFAFKFSLYRYVEVGNILAALMDRLTNHAQEAPEMVGTFVDVDAFGKFMGRVACSFA
jgi:hypothetical protein